MPLRTRNQFVVKTCSAERTHVLPLFVHIRECDLPHFHAQERDGTDLIGTILSLLDSDADFKKLVQDLDNVRGIDDLIKSRGGGYSSSSAPANQRTHETFTLQWWLDDHPHGLLNVMQLTRTSDQPRSQFFRRTQPQTRSANDASADDEDEEYVGAMYRPLPTRKAAIVAWIYPPHVTIPPTGDRIPEDESCVVDFLAPSATAD